MLFDSLHTHTQAQAVNLLESESLEAHVRESKRKNEAFDFRVREKSIAGSGILLLPSALYFRLSHSHAEHSIALPRHCMRGCFVCLVRIKVKRKKKA